MGYTNYWNPSKKLKHQTDAFPQVMLDEMTKVVEAYNAKQKKEEMKITYYITQKHIDLYGEPATYEMRGLSARPPESLTMLSLRLSSFSCRSMGLSTRGATMTTTVALNTERPEHSQRSWALTSHSSTQGNLI